MKNGIVLAFMTAGISGLSIFASKIFVSQMDPLVFTTLKNLLVAVALTGLLGVMKLFPRIKQYNKNQWLRLATVGIVGGGVPFALFFIGLSMTNALTASVIHKSLFIWVALLAVIFLKERLTKLQILGYLIVTYGAIWIAGVKTFTLGTGEFMIMIATLLWSIENIYAKKLLADFPSEIVGWARMTFGVVILLVITVIQGKGELLIPATTQQHMAVLTGGLLLTGYVLTWYKALSKAPATMVSLVLAASPVLTGLLTAIFITHTIPQLTEITSMAALGIGVVIAVRTTQKPAQANL